MVNPRFLLERLLVRLGGLAKECAKFVELVPLRSDAAIGRDVVDAALDMTKAPEVLTARFLRFFGFLPGVVDRCISKKVCDELSEVCGLIMPNEVGYGLASGDSGDDPGDISVAEESSMTDSVVVGDEFVDVDGDVDALCLCWWYDWNGFCKDMPTRVTSPPGSGLFVPTGPWSSPIIAVSYKQVARGSQTEV
jgi:hypothetical protein